MILIFSVFLYKNVSTKENLTPSPKPASKELSCPATNEGEIDTKCYNRQIKNLTDRYNFLMARVPITFYAGNIEYNYKTETPLVVFSGGVPYIYVNLRLPHPPPGDKGDPGNPGPTGNEGSKGVQGNSGLTGYSGSSYSRFLSNGTSK